MNIWLNPKYSVIYYNKIPIHAGKFLSQFIDMENLQRLGSDTVAYKCLISEKTHP